MRRTEQPVRSAHCLLEQRGEVGDLVRRVGILVRARPFKHVAAIDALPHQISRFARDSYQLLSAPVIGLDPVVSDSPILDGQALGQFPAVLFAQKCREGELLRVEAVGNAAPMLSGAAHARARIEGTVLADGHSVGARGMAMRCRLLSEVLHHAVAQGVIQFVHAGRVIG